MLIAQGLGEYGALTGGGSSRLGELLDTVAYSVRDAEPSTWILVSVGLLVVWFLFIRK
jgi:hypothetical protein